MRSLRAHRLHEHAADHGSGVEVVAALYIVREHEHGVIGWCLGGQQHFCQVSLLDSIVR
jgi:hypothetical protein